MYAFFGFLVYDHTDEFEDFIEEHDQTIDALIEITHSSEPVKYKRDYRTAKEELMCATEFRN